MPSCQVWFADIALQQAAHLALLDDIERGRRERYRQDVDQARFATGAALLRLVVAAELGIAPTSVRVDRACHRCGAPHGKPRVLGANLHVSVSHSGDLVALALTRDAPVGVDVEVMTDRDTAGLARTVLTDSEEIRGPADFYSYWCRKEAVVKATGDGLQVPLVDVVVSPPEAPARLISYQGAPLTCSMRDLPVDVGYAAALAVLAEGDLEIQIEDAAEMMQPSGHRSEALGR